MQGMKYLPLLVLLLAAGCTSPGIDMQSRILGTWESTVGGFTFETVYADNEVTVAGHSPVSYQLDGDQLVVAGDTVMARVVSFPAADIMEQLDPVTGTTHTYRRVSR